MNTDDEQVVDDTSDVQEESEQVETEAQAEAGDEQEEENVDWKAKALKAEEIAENYKIRAEKAEGKGKAPKALVGNNALSPQDLLALTKANVEADDLDDVLEWATFKKIPISEALKSSVLKATLAEKAEFRTSAAAVNTGSSRRASGAISDERLLADSEKGILPDSDSDIARLTKLRITRR